MYTIRMKFLGLEKDASAEQVQAAALEAHPELAVQPCGLMVLKCIQLYDPRGTDFRRWHSGYSSAALAGRG